MEYQATPARVMLLLNELQKQGFGPGHERVRTIFADHTGDSMRNWQDISRRLERLVADSPADDRAYSGRDSRDSDEPDSVQQRRTVPPGGAGMELG